MPVTIKEKLRSTYERWATKGIHLPFIYDPTNNKPSITLFFPYASFTVALASVIALHFKPALFIATSVSITFWVLSTILYMIRKINKAKFDLDDKSIELDAGDDKAPEKEAPKPPSRPSDAA